MKTRRFDGLELLSVAVIVWVLVSALALVRLHAQAPRDLSLWVDPEKKQIVVLATVPGDYTVCVGETPTSPVTGCVRVDDLRRRQR